MVIETANMTEYTPVWNLVLIVRTCKAKNQIPPSSEPANRPQNNTIMSRATTTTDTDDVTGVQLVGRTRRREDTQSALELGPKKRP